VVAEADSRPMCPWQPRWGVLDGDESKKITEDWLQATGLRLCDSGKVWPIQFAALFDFHDVLDSLNPQEAFVLGVHLEHLSNRKNFIPCFLCSFGKAHAEKAFEVIKPAGWASDLESTLPWSEMLDGCVFTDVRKNDTDKFEVYRPKWYPETAIRITGDKSDISRFLNIPTLLFDDKEENITIHSKGHRENKGVVVKRGRKARHQVLRGFKYCPDWCLWAGMINEFQKHLGEPDGLSAAASACGGGSPAASKFGGGSPHGGQGQVEDVGGQVVEDLKAKIGQPEQNDRGVAGAARSAGRSGAASSFGLTG